jgi:hypothetical protein
VQSRQIFPLLEKSQQIGQILNWLITEILFEQSGQSSKPKDPQLQQNGGKRASSNLHPIGSLLDDFG